MIMCGAAARRNADSVVLLRVSTNLVSGVWGANGVFWAGTGNVDSGFEAVTNRVIMDEKSGFVRCRIESVP